MQSVEQCPWYSSVQKPNSIPKIPGVPVIPPLPDPTKYAFQCGECGILVPNGPWMFSCPSHKCPIQPKVTC